MNVITLSIPAFFVLMGLEWLVGRVKKRRVYRGPDVLADLLLGSAQTLFGVVAAGVLLGGYLLLYERRFFDVSPSSALAWVVLLVGLDFLYYWFHRASHRMNLAWAAHALIPGLPWAAGGVAIGIALERGDEPDPARARPRGVAPGDVSQRGCLRRPHTERPVWEPGQGHAGQGD